MDLLEKRGKVEKSRGKRLLMGCLAQQKHAKTIFEQSILRRTFRSEKLAPRMHSETSAPVTSWLELEVEWSSVALVALQRASLQAGKVSQVQQSQSAPN